MHEHTAVVADMTISIGGARAATEQIVQGIGGVAEAARSTSDGAESTQTSAQDLASYAAALGELVARFRYESDTPDGAGAPAVALDPEEVADDLIFA